jgi:hypothetical protein
VTVDDHRLMSEDDPRTRLGSVNDQPLAGGGPAIPAANPQRWALGPALLIKLAAATMPFMHLEDDITLDELARELAAIYRPQSLQYLAAALRTIAKQQLSGLSPEQYWLERQGIRPTHILKREAWGRLCPQALPCWRSAAHP